MTRNAGARLLGSTILIAASVALCGGAQAQETPADAPNAQDIVVTGSRLITNGNNSPTPVTVASAEELLRTQPTTLVASLNALPEFAGSKGPSSGSQSGPPNGGNGAASLINLRNLTPDRTLILLDGQRFPPTLFTGGVDVDAIPEMLIQRVDVVTGGVSAVYGSDAVAGVVNFVTDKTFKGVKVIAQSGISTYGDDFSYKLGVAAGGNLGDNLHVEGSVSRYHDDGVLSRQDRAWLNNYAFGGNGTAANPYTLYGNVRQSNRSFGGLISCGTCSLNGYVFNANGVATAFNHGVSTSGNNTEVGGDGAYNDSGIKSPLTADQIFLRADYQADGGPHMFIQGAWNHKKNLQYYGWATLNNVTLSSTNPYLTSDLQTALSAGGSTFKLTKIFSQAPLMANNADEKQLYLNTGIDGDLGKFGWALTGTYADTKLVDTITNNPDNQHIAEALDTVLDGSGNVVCRAKLNGTDPSCVPLNPFGPTSASAAAMSYVLGTTHLNVHTKFYDVLGHIDGTLFDLPAGPFKASLSGEWRKVTLQYDTDHPFDEYVSCPYTPLANCNTASSRYGQVYGNRSEIAQYVKEGALEVSVPLLGNLPLVRDLTFSGAARYTSYSNAGDYWTWKAGLIWKLTDGLTARGTLSRDIHAPTLYQMYQAISIVPSTGTDYLTGAGNVAYNTVNKGNPNLKAEKGITRSAGIVWQPGSLPGFSLAFDTFYIKVKDAIQQVRGWDQAVQNACYATASTGYDSPYCSLQTRPAGFTSTATTNNVTAIAAQYLNIASVSTYGFDMELNYRGEVAGRPASFRLLGVYQPHIRILQPGVTPFDCGDAANCAANYQATAALRITASAHYEVTSGFAVDLQERFRGAMQNTGQVASSYNSNGASIIYASSVKPLAYTDLTFTFKVDAPAHPEFFVNVTNLFNTQPPLTAGSGNDGAGGPGQGWANAFDDPVGRYFTAGIRARF
ncbi:TonB-dependent receptor [Novosphingobium flavum]|uniref:TonB-dependent receptor n=1 Tax=Novosphingobium flavum TaxID=1778672 RepID=A0A7X1FQZ3_9SPHN|nr:TonB-dependent receptor [Novosphingobium flavum]MBC2665199.1 TonB-dependent receptor [Novosphingobium flavum]